MLDAYLSVFNVTVLDTIHKWCQENTQWSQLCVFDILELIPILNNDYRELITLT